ncbi:MAG: GDSL-type esterase/lipase family protein [Planctomycetes bacterium]|nr:GDSL-type esterase/lipase family protein [Planctomycetota bacterium]
MIPPGTGGRRTARTLALIAGGLCLALVILEGILQLLAWVVWVRGGNAPDAGGGSDGKVILCVGDSFTYGLGASSIDSASYPAQLERLLREVDGPGWGVRNRGWPAQDSRDVLRRIDRDLAEARPDLVYVLVGINDHWSQPPLEALPPPAEPAPGRSFLWRWRTVRVASLLRERFRRKPEPSPPGAGVPLDPFVGDWHWGRLRVRFHRDGRLSVGPSELRWTIDGKHLALEGLPGGPLRPSWFLDGNLLLLQGGNLPFPHVLTKEPPEPRLGEPDALESQALRRLAWRTFDENRFDQALELFQAALRENPSDVGVREGVVLVLQRLGRTPEAASHVAWLKEWSKSHRDRWTCEALANVMAEVGERDGSLEIARQTVEEFPDSAKAWGIIAWQASLLGDGRLSREGAEKALSLTPPDRHRERGFFHRLRAQALREADPHQALRSICQGFLEDGAEAFAIEQFRRGQEAYTPALLERCLDELSVTAEDRRRLLALFNRSPGDSNLREEVLASHLRQIVARCEGRGVRIVLLDYPMPDSIVAGAVRRAAEGTGAGRLAITSEFERLLQNTQREAWFVPDGHCNDRGYEVIARRAVEDARQRLR